MVSLAALAELGRLLDAVAAVEGRLAPNELELYRSLKAKYAEGAGDPDPTDLVCLRVMLRNVGVREGFGHDPRSAPPRLIEPVPRRRR